MARPIPAVPNGPVPTVLVVDDSGHEVAQEAADIDSEVEDVEASVFEVAVFRVEPAKHRGDVGLEQTVADDEKSQSEVEHAQAFERQTDVASDHDDGADHDRLAVAEDAISDDAADEGGEVDQGGVATHDRAHFRHAHVQAALGRRGAQELRQETEHEVEREPFPHLGHEQAREFARVLFGPGLLFEEAHNGSSSSCVVSLCPDVGR